MKDLFDSQGLTGCYLR